MTEAELILAREAVTQSTIAIGDLQASHIAIYLTLVFAYISFAYLAGKDLSRPMAILLSVLFVFAAGSEVMNIVQLAQGSTSKLLQLRELSMRTPIPPTSHTIWDNVALWSTGIVGALVFMWTVRRNSA